MNHLRISAITLAVSMTVGAGLALAQGPRAAPQDDADGEILATYHCPRHGYTLRVIRPTGYGDSDARQIQVEYSGQFFHATWNEVSNLIDNHPVNNLQYEALPSNPGQDGARYCVRTGHLIPTDQTVYQVALAHYGDYNGNSSVFFDSNAEASTFTHLINQYNSSRDQGDALPATCQSMECLDGGSGVSGSGSGGGGWTPGTYTSAEGRVRDLFDLNPPSQDDDDGTDTPVHPSIERTERIRIVPGTAAGSDGGDGDAPLRIERNRAVPR